MTSPKLNPELITTIRTLLTESRRQLHQTVNTTMVQTYWQIGQLIIEDEQQGEARASYGKHVLKQLAESLTKEFDKGFDIRNLTNMRKFYLTFPIRNAVRTELSWTHYRTLVRIESTPARNWYMNEAIEQSWSARALDRQIGALYYERLLSSKEKQPVIDEAAVKTTPLAESPKDYLRDPYIFDFYGHLCAHV